MDHIVVKAVQTLITAGQHHLVRDAAYYRWLNERRCEAGHDLEDWYQAEALVFRRIEAVPSSVVW